MAGEKSFAIRRALDRIPQKGFGQGRHHIRGSAGRSAMLRLDRRDQKEARRRELHHAIHAAKAKKHLEQRQPRSRRALDEGRQDEAAGNRCLQGEGCIAFRRLLVRAHSRHPRAKNDQAVQAKPRRLGILREPAPILSSHRIVVGNQRKEGRDAGRTARAADRVLIRTAATSPTGTCAQERES